MRSKAVKRFILLTFLVSICMVFLCLTGCSKSESDTVRIAFFPNITHSQALVGQANGAFEKAFGEGVDVNWISFNAGPAEIEAIFAGEVDIGYIGPIPAINGFTKSNGDIKIIAGATNGGAVLVTRSDLTLDSAAELGGKRIAVPQFGNTQHLSLLHILTEYGLKSTDNGGTVQIFESQNADTKTLMDKGDIDAALIPEPWGARLVGEIGANILLDEKQIWRDGDYSTAVVIVSTEFMEKSPELVEKFLQTHVELTEYINDNSEEAKSIINEQLDRLTQNKLDEKVLDEAFDRLIISYDPARESISQFIDIYIEENFISECKNRDSLIDLCVLNRALNEKGLPGIK